MATKTDPQILTIQRILRHLPALDDAGRCYIVARVNADMGKPPVIDEEDAPETARPEVVANG